MKHTHLCSMEDPVRRKRKSKLFCSSSPNVILSVDFVQFKNYLVPFECYNHSLCYYLNKSSRKKTNLFVFDKEEQENRKSM